MTAPQEVKTALEKKFPDILKDKIVMAADNYIWAEPISSDNFCEVIDFTVTYLGFNRLHMMTEDSIDSVVIIIYALSDSSDNMLVLKQTVSADTPFMCSVSSLFGNIETCEREITARSAIQFDNNKISLASKLFIFDNTYSGHTYAEILDIIERSGDTSPHNTASCYAAAAEFLVGITPPPRAKYIRVLFAESERLHNHLLSLALLFRDRGFDALFRTVLSDRELFLDAVCKLGGSRMIYGMNALGGVSRDAASLALINMSQAVDELNRRLKQYSKNSGNNNDGDKQAQKRKIFNPIRIFNNYLYTEAADGATEVFDPRKSFPYSAYAEIPFAAIQHDCTNPQSLLAEMRESLHIIRFILDHLPEGKVTVDFPAHVPAGESLSLCQAANGAITVYIRSDGTDKPPKISLFTGTAYSMVEQTPIIKYV